MKPGIPPEARGATHPLLQPEGVSHAEGHPPALGNAKSLVHSSKRA